MAVNLDRTNTQSELTVPVQPRQRGVDKMPAGGEVSWIKYFAFFCGPVVCLAQHYTLMWKPTKLFSDKFHK